MPEDTKSAKPSEEGTPSGETVSKEEFEKLQAQMDASIKGFNEKAQTAAERAKQIDVLEAKIGEMESSKDSAVDAEARAKRLEELTELLDSDEAAKLQLQAEDRANNTNAKVSKELKELKRFKAEMETERYNARLDKALLKAGVDPDTDIGAAMKAIAEKEASFATGRGENYTAALDKQIKRVSELYKTLNVGDKTVKKETPVENAKKTTTVPTGGETPKETPKKTKYQTDSEQTAANIASYEAYAERSE
jgi:hypothetical protein